MKIEHHWAILRQHDSCSQNQGFGWLVRVSSQDVCLTVVFSLPVSHPMASKAMSDDDLRRPAYLRLKNRKLK